MHNNKTIDLFLYLLRLGLGIKDIPPPIIDEKTKIDWNEIYRLAVRHGVCANVWDGLILLPEIWLPPRTLRLQWALNTENIVKRYMHQKEILNRITSLFRKQALIPIIIKGISLSTYYPIPHHREFGDIDFYLGENFDLGNTLLLANGACKVPGEHNSDKHSVFILNKVMLENHRMLNNNDKIGRLAEYQARVWNYETQITPEGFTSLSPRMNALFLPIHAASHFRRNDITIRHLCDWGLFLQHERRNLDLKELHAAYMHIGISDFTNILTILSEYILHGDYSWFAEASKYNKALVQRCLDIVLFPQNNITATNSLHRFILRCQRAWQRKWTYKLIPGNFWIEIYRNFIKRALHKD